MEEAKLNLINVDDALNKAMTVKNEWELSCIEQACVIAEKAFLQLLPEIKEGMTETQVAALLEYKMRSLGAEGVSFETIVAFGAHAAVPHHVTGDTKLTFGDEILISVAVCRGIVRILQEPSCSAMMGNTKNSKRRTKRY